MAFAVNHLKGVQESRSTIAMAFVMGILEVC